MANKKSNEEVHYIVLTEEYPLESGDHVSVFKDLEKAYFETMQAWEHEDVEGYFVYEVRKIGKIKLTTEA
jgi:hypothetical protein